MKRITFIIILVVVAIHLSLLVCLIQPKRERKSPDAQPQEQQAEQTSPQTAQTGETQTQTQMQPPPPAASEPEKPRWPQIPVYSDVYFQKAPRPLPQKLQEAAANCKAGVAVDLSSHTILWAKNESTSFTIASLTKMVTTMLAVKKLYDSNGELTLETPIRATREAAKIGGSQIWLDPSETFTFNELLKCILVHSANDAAYLLAQYCGGTADAFVQQMNDYTRQLGCKSFRFINPNGLPEKERNNEENSANAIELAYIADQLLKLPEITAWSGVRIAYTREHDEAYLKKHDGKATMLVSSNPLLGKCPGVNGMKTGFTNNSKFCLVATCERNGKSTCIVLLGCDNKQVRNTLAFGLVEWLYQ